MAFSLDDMLERLGVGGTRKGRECIREEAASVKVASHDEIRKLFPNVTLSDSKEIVYAPFVMCHSLPKVNLRGRCFTAKTLSNSFASVRDALVNIDHQMSYRKNGVKEDTICGHVVCGRFDPYGKYAEELANASESDPIPLLALAAFYLRSKYIPALLEEHLSKVRTWRTSMECSHDYEQANFLYRGEFIPVKDAEAGMRECVQKLSVRPYKGHPLALALGGKDGTVDFHAAALTPEPADQDCDILAFVTKDEYVEAASRTDNPFFFPLESYEFPKLPKTEQEISLDELANIAVLGKTEAAEDGHVHDILTDGTIVPVMGHTHYLGPWTLVRGTTPRLTGRTDSHYEYYRDNSGAERSKVHMHLIDIPLRGKGKGTEDAGTETASQFQEPFVYFDVENPMQVDLNSVVQRIGRLLAKGKYEGEAATEVASLQSDLAKLSQNTIIQETVKTEIANAVAKGELLTKEEHDKQVAAAAQAEKDKAEAERKKAEALAARREKVLALGIDLDSKFSDSVDVSVGDYINSFGLDDAGEKNFKVALVTLEALSKKEEAPTPTPAATESQQQLTGTETVAANKGTTTPVTPKKKKVLIVGGGHSSTEEGEEEANKPAASQPKVGKHLFSSAVN